MTELTQQFYISWGGKLRCGKVIRASRRPIPQWAKLRTFEVEGITFVLHRPLKVGGQWARTGWRATEPTTGLLAGDEAQSQKAVKASVESRVKALGVAKTRRLIAKLPKVATLPDWEGAEGE